MGRLEETKEMMQEALKSGAVIKTTPRISKEDAKHLERIIDVVKKQGRDGKVSIFGENEEDIELIDGLTRTYLEIKLEDFESGGRVVDAHKTQAWFEEARETVFNINGISPWVEHISLIELLEVGGYQWKD